MPFIIGGYFLPIFWVGKWTYNLSLPYIGLESDGLMQGSVRDQLVNEEEVPPPKALIHLSMGIQVKPESAKKRVDENSKENAVYQKYA